MNNNSIVFKIKIETVSVFKCQISSEDEFKINFDLYLVYLNENFI